MLSLRKFANCIGISGDFSLKNDFLGYTTFGVPSLLAQLRLLQGPHIHLNLIEVGSDFKASDEFTIDFSLAIARSIYATVGIGVGRVERYTVPTAQAEGHDVIDSDSEAETVFSRWVVDNVGIDVLIVLLYLGTHAGLSPVRGTCNKHHKGPKGCVVSPSQNIFGIGHEVGHYLGLSHVDDPDNLMNATPGSGIGIVNLNANDSGFVDLPQGVIMLGHCSIRAGCPG